MAKKPKTPSELAKEIVKDHYSFTLIKSNMDILKKWAARDKISVSSLVDEAIKNYIEVTEEKN